MLHLAHSSGTARKMCASTSLGRPQMPSLDMLWRMRLASGVEPWDILAKGPGFQIEAAALGCFRYSCEGCSQQRTGIT